MDREAIEDQSASAQERVAQTECRIAEQRLRVYKQQGDGLYNTAAMRSLDAPFNLKTTHMAEVSD